MASLALVVAAVFVSVKWQDGGRQLGWRPVTAAAKQAIESCSDPMYNGLYEGGQLIWFVPTRPVFIDGRVEAYPREFMLQAKEADVEGQYEPLFARYGIHCVVTRPGMPLFAKLQRDATMRLVFRDDELAIFER
jgi:hypothetical protein